MGAIGRQLILELWECDPQSLDAPDTVKRAIKEAVSASGATLVRLLVHRFPGVGITGIAVLAESHMVVHTWPEYGYAAVDLFTCGESADPARSVPALRRRFSPKRVQVTEIERGAGATPGEAEGRAGRPKRSALPQSESRKY